MNINMTEYNNVLLNLLLLIIIPKSVINYSSVIYILNDDMMKIYLWIMNKKKVSGKWQSDEFINAIFFLFFKKKTFYGNDTRKCSSYEEPKGVYGIADFVLQE